MPGGVRGLPEKSIEPPVVVLAVMQIAFRAVFLVVADYIRANTAVAEERIRIAADYDLQYLFLVILFAKLALEISNLISVHTRRSPCINPPDQYVYKIAGSKKGDDQSNYVVLENEGEVGKFNRAQRGVGNFLEYYTAFISLVLVTGFIYPYPTFIIGSIFAFGRVLYSYGYTLTTNGRTLGFMLATFSITALDGLVLVAAARCFGVNLIF